MCGKSIHLIIRIKISNENILNAYIEIDSYLSNPIINVLEQLDLTKSFANFGVGLCFDASYEKGLAHSLTVEFLFSHFRCKATNINNEMLLVGRKVNVVIINDEKCQL